MQEKYGSEVYKSHPRLQTAVIKAWDSITDVQVIKLVGTIHERCQAAIDARGWHTKY